MHTDKNKFVKLAICYANQSTCWVSVICIWVQPDARLAHDKKNCRYRLRRKEDRARLSNNANRSDFTWNTTYVAFHGLTSQKLNVALAGEYSRSGPRCPTVTPGCGQTRAGVFDNRPNDRFIVSAADCCLTVVSMKPWTLRQLQQRVLHGFQFCGGPKMGFRFLSHVYSILKNTMQR